MFRNYPITIQTMCMSDNDLFEQILEIKKNKFLDEKHLDWYVQTYIRNYPEFLENDYNNAMV